ncbi:MAG: anti sigma factor C-terminal domain-containing protein [Clostridium sp.]|uniref:anti sigma factor C-terminal domain-containing protein n=1 Tax=Clostridium sp. TaxID=1506 RepID=UPI003D6CC1F0
MNFKSQLEKYKNGNASAEEIKLIKEELNKYEAIEDYLSESYDLSFQNEISNETIKNENNFVKNSVNKKLRKMILASVAIVFSILFAFSYIVLPIIGSFYYNPSKKEVGKFHEDSYFDLKAFTELNSPGYAIASASSENLGFGKYNIYFERLNLFNREIKNVNVNIERNIRIGNLENYFANSFLEFKDHTQPNSNNKLIEIQNEKVINYIKELNHVSYISSYIKLKENLSLKEFDELKKRYNDKVSFKWVAVRTENEAKSQSYLSGFNPDYNNIPISEDTANKNKYPYLQLGDYWTDGWDKVKPNDSMVVLYTKHFTSLLRYMIDRENAVKALDNNEIKIEYYKNALNYVEKNGINIYGLLICGESRDLLKFIDEQNIKTIEIKGVLPSKYIN